MKQIFRGYGRDSDPTVDGLEDFDREVNKLNLLE